MAETELGLTLTEEEINSRVSFFDALDGTMPTIVYPKLPRVTKSTPKPDVN